MREQEVAVEAVRANKVALVVLPTQDPRGQQIMVAVGVEEDVVTAGAVRADQG